MTVQDRVRRLQGFYETGAIGVYDADDLHSDVRWLLHAYQELRGAMAMVATYEATPDPDPWQDLSAKASVFQGMKRLAVATLETVDIFDPDV
jgi:hypothetical protein